MAGVTRLRRQHLRYLAQAAPGKMAWRHHCAGFRQTSNRERDGRTARAVGLPCSPTSFAQIAGRSVPSVAAIRPPARIQLR